MNGEACFVLRESNISIIKTISYSITWVYLQDFLHLATKTSLLSLHVLSCLLLPSQSLHCPVMPIVGLLVP